MIQTWHDAIPGASQTGPENCTGRIGNYISCEFLFIRNSYFLRGTRIERKR
jgi:hypothetical protein